MTREFLEAMAKKSKGKDVLVQQGSSVVSTTFVAIAVLLAAGLLGCVFSFNSSIWGSKNSSPTTLQVGPAPFATASSVLAQHMVTKHLGESPLATKLAQGVSQLVHDTLFFHLAHVPGKARLLKSSKERWINMFDGTNEVFIADPTEDEDSWTQRINGRVTGLRSSKVPTIEMKKENLAKMESEIEDVRPGLSKEQLAHFQGMIDETRAKLEKTITEEPNRLARLKRDGWNDGHQQHTMPNICTDALGSNPVCARAVLALMAAQQSQLMACTPR